MPRGNARAANRKNENILVMAAPSFASLEDDTKDGICSEAREAEARRSPLGNTSATPELGYGDDEDEAARGRWFEEFWETYPKKMGIDEAEQAFFSVVTDRDCFDRVMDGLSAWCASDEWQEQGGRFVPRAAAFLRDRRFLMPPTTRDRGDGGGKQSTADRAHGGERKRAQSFDIDDFFEAALRRSYGEDAGPYRARREAVAKMVQNLTRAPSVFCFAKSTSLPEGGLGAEVARGGKLKQNRVRG